MIRNYYTDSYKTGIPVVASDVNLLDGRVKITESTTSTSVLNAATSVTLVLTLNVAIQRGMYITGPTTPVVGINDHLLVEAVVHGATTTVTLNKPFAMNAGQVLTFFNIAQSSWEQYNLYIGRAAAAPATTAVVTPATTTSTTISWVIPNPNVMSGMTISGTGIPAGITVISVAADGLSIVASAPLSIANQTVLTFSFATLNTLKVLTTDNQEVTFNNLQSGTILPVSVVQVYSAGTLGVDNMTALY
jgi:hypothetical protein